MKYSDAKRAADRKYAAAHSARRIRRAGVWRRLNSARHAAFQGLHKARKYGAVPAFADLTAMRDMYMEAQFQGLQVDHIVPLIGRNVCGLHWEGNLQLLTPADNKSKGDHTWPDR